MSLIDSLIRGWYTGWSEPAELVAGGAGLVESLIPGEQDFLTTTEDYWNKKAEAIRAKGGPGKSEGLIEKVVEGIGAAPGTIASMAPFLIGGGASIPGAAIGFGLHGLVRHGDEGLPTAAGYGLKGVAEGALFGGAGKIAGRIAGKPASEMLRKQADLYKAGSKETVAAAKAMKPEIEAALDLPLTQLKRRTAHAGMTGGIVGGMGLLHGQPLEDAAAGAATMGILGFAGGMTPKQIAGAGKYKDPFTQTKQRLDELEGEALLAGKALREKRVKEAEERIGAEQPPVFESASKLPDGTVQVTGAIHQAPVDPKTLQPFSEVKSFTGSANEFIAGFVDKNTGRFYDRVEALEAARGVKKISKQDGLGSEDLMVQRGELGAPKDQSTPWTETAPSDFAGRGQRTKPLAKETEAWREQMENAQGPMIDVIAKYYKEKGPYKKQSAEDAALEAAEFVVRAPDGSIQAPAEKIHGLAHYFKDLQKHNQQKLVDLDVLIEKAKQSGDEIAIERYTDMKNATLIQSMNDFGQYKGYRSSVGASLNSLKETKRGTPEWVKQSEVVKKNLGVEADRVIKMLEMSQDRPDLMVKIADAVNNPKAWDYFQEYWINGLLSGPPTHFVNILSNTLRSAVDIAEKRVALEMEHRRGYLVPGKEPGTRVREYLTREEVKGEFQADLSAVVQSFRVAAKAFKEGLRSEDFDITTIDPRYSGLQVRGKIDYPAKTIPGKIGEVIRFPGRALIGMDVAFKIIAGERAAASMAYRMASKAIKAGEITEMQRADYMAKLRGVGTDKPHKDILAAMKKEAEFQTFTERMPEWAAPIGKLRQTEFMGVKPGVAVLPFMSTPFNVIKQSILRSPVGILMHKNIKAKYERGEITPKEYYQDIAATALGTTMTAGLIGLAKAGFITGGGPINPQDRANKIATGWRPYSLHFPGYGYQPLQRIEPFGTILGMAGDIAELGDAEDKLGKLVATVKDNITDKSFLYGLESFSKAFSNPEMFFSTYYRQMVGSLVPTGAAKIQQAIDPYARDVETLGATTGIPDPIAYRLPGMSQALSLRTTPLGEPQERWGAVGADSGIVGRLTSAIAPAAPSAERPNTEVEREFDRLSRFKGMPPSTPRREKPPTGLRGVNGENVKLTEAEYRIYDKYHAIAKQQLNSIIQSPAYQRLPDDRKAELLRSIYDKFRRAANNEINVSIRRRTTVGE